MSKLFTTRKAIVAGALGAVSILLAVTPLGYLPWFGGVSITIMHVPVIIAAVLEGPIAGAIVGLIFGVSSLVKAAVMPLTPFDPLFVNPFISVLPRLLVGLVAYFAFRPFRGKLSALAYGVAGVAGSITNTALVLGMLYLISGQALAGIMQTEVSAVPAILGGIVLSNGVLEAAAAAILTVAVASAWRGVEGKLGKAKLAGEE